ncbi:hypothetical protein PHYC_02821 [Phycisphaerales bacterium]|nr:hypothetical protein PHYC_02821 [Phycisphaerales bacterium]
MMIRTFAAMAGLAAASCAQAATFSFASDNLPFDPMFRGSGSSIIGPGAANQPVILLVDDNNGPAPALSFQTEFVASFSINYLGSSAMPLPGKYAHNYGVTGTFRFHDFNNGSIIMSSTLEGGLLTVVGNGSGPVSPTTWDDAGAMSFSSAWATVTYVWNGGDLPAYGLFNGGTPVGPRDGAFTLTAINNGGIPGVPVNSLNGLPVQSWNSEASFSGMANFIPAPGALALTGLAGVAALRRRRR